MDPKHCTLEEMAFLVNKNKELEDKLAKIAAAYEEHKKAYSLLESIYDHCFDLTLFQLSQHYTLQHGY